MLVAGWPRGLEVGAGRYGLSLWGTEDIWIVPEAQAVRNMILCLHVVPDLLDVP